MAQLAVTPTGTGSGVTYYNPGTWATVHDAATGAGAEANSTSGWMQAVELGGTHYITRIHLVFDTSALPDDCVITSVTLAVKESSTGHTGTGSTGAVVGNTQASSTAVSTADYDQLGTTLFSDTQTIAGSDGTVTTFTFTAAGIAAISKTGYTQLGIRDYTYDILNSDPAARNDSNIYIMTSDKYPTLTINYEPVSTQYLKERYHNREDMGGYSLG